MPAAADALADIVTVMGAIGRALPISTALPRPEAADCRWLPRHLAPEEPAR
ncbi:hypothetical protein L7D48_07040 [Streptomyces sp. S1A]|uniref:hypothetical protein n=1 Tax=Streptomyces sp. ICN903 TaxID=2964654 RepID=UPI001EDB7E45|nr:hypothetical protein [Streptomyces sp. ICN903]MCG3040328.1 hypothetical protein [Streptomyces sp. ICN903]